MVRIKLLSFLVVFCGVTLAQENTQTRIPASLAECYANQDIFERDNRLPMTVNMLVELIRRIEDSPEWNGDITALTVALVHRFRQDGIERAQGVFTSPSVLPFSPSGMQFTKHRILLSRLIPGNAMTFPNNTLTARERCALHFMMSSSIDRAVRGDEATRCNQLAQYRAMRVPRGARNEDNDITDDNNFVGDIEMLASEDKARPIRSHSKFGRYQEMGEEEPEADPAEDEPPVEDDAVDENGDEGLDMEHQLIDVASNAISQCPVENGVIRTQWGAVAVGPMITGIAAGLIPQTVTARELLSVGRARGEYRARQGQNMAVDNRWASTLSGDLSEVALIQGPVAATVNVGAPGAWNSTTTPRWYFLSQRERLEMTDAEIRGGLDGLILAMGIAEWRSRAPGIRLSQVIDMYYSHRGVFDQNTRSCNRRSLFTNVAPLATLQQQTTSFSVVLDKEMQLRVTLDAVAIQDFSNAAAEALTVYIPQSLNDLSCAATSQVPNDDTIWRAAAEIMIFLDTSWQFREIEPILSNMMENLETNRFGSNIRIFNAMDGTLMMNTTNQLTEFYSTFNDSLYQMHPPGFNFPNVLRVMRDATNTLMDFERATTATGGRALVAIIMPSTGTPNEADTNFAVQHLQIIREEVPDLRLLFFAGGSAGRFNRFVQDETRDIFTLRPTGGGIGDQVQTQVNPVVTRIQQVPRRIINHRCGSNWQTNEWGNNQMNQYVEPFGIVFYRVHPNYFYLPGDNRRVRIQGHGYSSITVCHSRRVELPRANQTNVPNQADVNCRQINSESIEINLSNACEGHSFIHHCPPLYISVEGSRLATGDSGSMRCSDPECRFPDNARFGVLTENLGCFSSAGQLFATISLILSSLFFLLKT